MWRVLGDQRLLPVAARGADGQEVEQHDVLGELGHQRRQAFDALDDALSLGAFVDPGGVVLPIHMLAEAAVAHRFRPAGEDVDVGGIINEVDQVGAGRSGRDLAEDGFARWGAKPFHVGEAGLEVERSIDRFAHFATGAKFRRVHVADDDGLR